LAGFFFEAFYTTKSKGVGMGLSICRSIISANGGRLWAETIKPRSAVFLFTLPAVQVGAQISSRQSFIGRESCVKVAFASIRGRTDHHQRPTPKIFSA
jgi:hypothetical protein